MLIKFLTSFENNCIAIFSSRAIIISYQQDLFESKRCVFSAYIFGILSQKLLKALIVIRT